MNPSHPDTTAFVVATAAHAGFQLTVTALVYPNLVRLLVVDRWRAGLACWAVRCRAHPWRADEAAFPRCR
jgi:hypothetical protein